MIVAVGHGDLTPATLELVESELRARMERVGEGVTGLVRAGAGLPVAFGRAVRAAGRKLVVLLPAQQSVPAVPPGHEGTGAGELLMLAEQVRLLALDPADRNACIGADERLVGASNGVLAVWDGSPSTGRDATAHLVAYARARGIPVDIVWPSGASRSQDGGPGDS
ncbi:hypothetical protein [Streptomyces sp. YIM S03343]